jgi:hypothetical protein
MEVVSLGGGWSLCGWEVDGGCEDGRWIEDVRMGGGWRM